MQDYCEEIGKSFGGTVYRLPIEKVDEFINESPELDKTGKTHLLRSLGIPESFYERQFSDFQKDIVRQQKIFFRDKSTAIDLLEDGSGKVIYASHANELSVKDPAELLSVSEETGWLVLRSDARSGFIRYVYRGDISPREENFKPVTFCQVPIFYNGNTFIELGLLRGVCLNSLVERNKNANFTWKPEKIDGMGSYLNSLAPEISKKAVDVYADMLHHYEGLPMDIVQAREMLNGFLNAENSPLPKTLVNLCHKHLDMIEDDEQIEGPVPLEIKSEMDMINVFTYYAKDLPSMGSQTKAESNLLKILKNKYNALKDVENQVQSLALAV